MEATMGMHANTGGLWPNSYKQKSTDPDLQDTLMVGGKPVKIVAWYTDGKNNKPKLSIRVNHPNAEQTEPAVVGTTYNEPPKEADDDIPF